MHVDNQSNVLNRTYTYSSTQNDGRIETMVDAVSGETVQYQYDSLKRLISAETTGTQWGQSFSYDGFGNPLAQTVTKGSAPSLSVLVSGTTNRITSAGYSYDSNGNLTAAPGLTMSYDVENRTVSATRSGSGTEYYAYGPSNERVWKREEFTGGIGYSFFYFYGVDGALLTTDGIDDDWDYNVYFAGRHVWRERTGFNWQMPAMAVSPDRLGSTVKHFPYGDEPTTTAPNREKFATYFRDEVTALDYARNRYYSSTIARFTTADPYGPSARPGAPQTWNRYSYVGGDPVNRNDPSGLYADCDWWDWGCPAELLPDMFLPGAGGGEDPCVRSVGGFLVPVTNPACIAAFMLPVYDGASVVNQNLALVSEALDPLIGDALLGWSTDMTATAFELTAASAVFDYMIQSGVAVMTQPGEVVMGGGILIRIVVFATTIASSPVTLAVAGVAAAATIGYLIYMAGADLRQVEAAGRQVSREHGCRRTITDKDTEQVHRILGSIKGRGETVSWDDLLEAWRMVLCS